jgi:hypothetical protein
MSHPKRGREFGRTTIDFMRHDNIKFSHQHVACQGVNGSAMPSQSDNTSHCTGAIQRSAAFSFCKRILEARAGDTLSINAQYTKFLGIVSDNTFRVNGREFAPKYFPLILRANGSVAWWFRQSAFVKR